MGVEHLEAASFIFNTETTNLLTIREIWGRILRILHRLVAKLPYNQNLVERIRILLEEHTGIIEKKMFGGVGFILNGNMACGVLGSDLIVRVGPDKNSEALSRAYVKPFLTPGGKPMSGWVLVAMQGLATDQELRQWVEQGYEFALSLPEKK